MKQTAFLFPGQGSQHEGMGLDYAASFESANNLYQRAHSLLGWSVLELSRPDKKDDLNITLYTQPAIYTLSCIIADRLHKAGVNPTFTAGHSAGEFAALTAAGAWDFETGLKVIAERARLMHETATPGTMAAVMGLSPEEIQSACEEWKNGIVCAANFNSPKQTVITGEPEAVAGIASVLKEKGAKRVLPLKVSGAFHSPLMKEAQIQFNEFLKNIPINNLTIPWISNNTGQPIQDASVVRELLVKQFCEPVRWVDTMSYVASHCDNSIEVGPGEVLKGLVKACCPTLACMSTDSGEMLANTLKELNLQAVCSNNLPE